MLVKIILFFLSKHLRQNDVLCSILYMPVLSNDILLAVTGLLQLYTLTVLC